MNGCWGEKGGFGFSLVSFLWLGGWLGTESGSSSKEKKTPLFGGNSLTFTHSPNREMSLFFSLLR